MFKWNYGEEDSTGRRKPIEKKDSEFELDVDCVIMALGTKPNPIVLSNKNEIKLNKYGCIEINEESGQTSEEGIFAGGDSTSGAATVILAMEAGKKAAKGIHNYISEKCKDGVK